MVLDIKGIKDLNHDGIFMCTTFAVSFLIVILLLWFHLRRHLEPIRSRLPIRVELSVISYLVYINHLSVSLEFNDGFDCALVYASGVIFGPAMVVVFIIRALHIHSVYEVAQETIRPAKERILPNQANASINLLSDIKSTNRHSFFVRHAKLIQSGRFQLMLFLGVTLINVAIFIGFVVLFLGDDCYQDPEKFDIGTYVIGSIAIFYVLACVLVALLMRPLEDGFHIKQEVVVSGLIALVGALTWLILSSFEQGESEEDILTYEGDYVVAVTVFLIASFQLGFPLFKTYSWEIVASSPLTQGETQSPLLAELLESAEGYKAFETFLVKEFSNENLRFYDVSGVFCEEFKNLDFVYSEFLEQTKQLYEHYISPNGIFWINISDKSKRMLVEVAGINSENPDPKALIQALQATRKEIYELMSADSFQRFLRSQLYKDYKARVEGMQTTSLPSV